MRQHTNLTPEEKTHRRARARALSAEGLSTQDIATRLGVSTKTVRTYRSQIQAEREGAR